MEMLPRSTAATSAPKQQQTGSLSSQVAVLRDKNWKMKTRKQEVGEEITTGVMYSVMILFGLLSRNPIASPREFEFPVQHAPALDLKCGQGNDTSLLVYTPNDKTVNDALHDAIRLLDTPMCTEGFATREAAETALRTNSSLRDMTAAYVRVRAPSTSSEWSYSIALPSDVSSSLNLQAAANRPSFVRSFTEGRGWSLNSTNEFATTGVLRLVWALNRGLAEAHTGCAGAMQQMLDEAGGDLFVSRLPLPSFDSQWETRPFIFILYALIGLSAISGALTSMTNERDLVEGLRVMGLSPMASCLAWCPLYMKILELSVVVASITFAAARFFPHSDPFLLFWITIQLTAFACLAFVMALYAILPIPNSIVAKLLVFGVGIGGGFGLGEASYSMGTQHPESALVGLAFCLHPYAALAIGINQFFYRELDGLGLRFESLMDSQVPLPFIWLMQIASIVLFVLLTKYFTEVRVEKRPWLFFVPSAWLPCCGPAWVEPAEASYSGSSGGGSMRDSSSGSDTAAVRIDRVAKTFFGDGGTRIQALSDLTLEMEPQQVTALLGQNGAGKSTAIGILTGLYPPSSGSARILGRSVRSAMHQIRQMMGVCPQHDLLFSHLTCLEHLHMFATVKGIPVEQTEAEAAQLIPKVGLHGKQLFWSDNLSGGQKRKLSVAAALIGDPKFVLLDEPTAGMDPHSRRAIWDVVRAAKAERTVLLTTHFMDEADALADRIAILSHGRILTTGTPLELKMAHGRGYHLTVACSSVEDAESLAPQLLASATEHVPSATLEPAKDGEVSVGMPLDSATMFAPLFRSLDELGAARTPKLEYGLALPTLQEVFLNILDREGGASAYTKGGSAENAVVTSGTIAPSASFGAQYMTMVRKQLADLGNSGPTPLIAVAISIGCAVLTCVIAGDASAGTVDNARMRLSVAPYFEPAPGTLLPVIGGSPELRARLDEGSQLQKRYAYKPLLLSAGGSADSLVAAAHMLNRNLSTDSGAYGAFVLPTLGENASAVLFNSSLQVKPVADFLSLLDEALLELACSNLTQGTRCLTLASNITNLDRTLGTDTEIDFERLMLVPIIFGAALASSNGLCQWLAARDRAYGCRHQLQLMGMDVRMLIAGQLTVDMLVMLVVPTSVCIAGAVVGTFALEAYPILFLNIALGQLSLRFLQAIFGALSSGRRPPAWLLAYLVYVVLSSILDVISNPRLVGAEVALILDFVFGFSPVSIVSTTVRSAAIISQGLARRASGLEKSPATFFSMTVSSDALIDPRGLNADQLDDPTFIAPGSFLVYGIVLTSMLGYGLYQTEVKGFVAPSAPPASSPEASSGDARAADASEEPPVDYWHIFCWPDQCWLEATGKTKIEEARSPLLMLWNWPILVVGVFRTIAILACAPWKGLPRKKPVGADDPERALASKRSIADDDSMDEDVAAERQRVLDGGPLGGHREERAGEDRVRVLDLRKEFSSDGGSTVAVDDLCFGAQPGSCFALLGSNGAGKTTSMSMLTGLVRPTSGMATLCGLSIWTELLEIFKLTGFCPQFGGLWPHMTLRQHLLIYLRLRGFYGESLLDEAQRIERAYGLAPHSAKRMRACSGGTRRKLNTAIALSCGQPKIVFLDEPTTGVDVGTRRFIWDRVLEATQTATVLLTTHYMDEADTLSDRIGIMARGRLRVLGSPQHLKNRHGGGYRLEVKGAAETADAVRDYLTEVFGDLTALEVHGGYQAYEVVRRFALAAAFEALEKAKLTLQIESYTLSQTTLDQVFLNIAYKYAVESEPVQWELDPAPPSQVVDAGVAASMADTMAVASAHSTRL